MFVYYQHTPSHEIQFQPLTGTLAVFIHRKLQEILNDLLNSQKKKSELEVLPSIGVN